ncbi:hypothetical protein PCANC_03902 [Puccinia coronata f. sp. avenae]|uniref:Uncharacterized protein n=1 Tax=Puccinia coronata f. sp. avenae TaxID=200324 RepID=A0A2N5SA34_9BASI|nr:hypothetical protein PCASD_22580 [Puccinia coronata f. sp. avenae]PLW20913.1 hypothetical protein PCANC_08663 [Puccinia coronata f. sp. avenae]PLW49324.1 hypothetical protein PCASD_02669 [Puccinia coronata f. sp. avenae]PLW56073.1 hypothetical protein PCANC_03902 [Puccinia coronata f. sp. avenae]
MAVCKFFYAFITITLIARSCLSATGSRPATLAPLISCSTSASLSASDCKSASNMLTYNTDKTFKARDKEIKNSGGCSILVNRYTKGAVTKAQIDAAAGIMQQPNKANSFDYQVELNVIWS